MNKLVTRRLSVVVIVAVLGLSACAPELVPEKIEPVVLEPLEDGRNLVTLTEDAAKRLDIQTENVREEQIVKFITVAGEVVPNTSSASNPKRLWCV